MTTHILLSSVGVWPRDREHSKTNYSLDNQTSEHYFSAFGLFSLLEKCPDEIWFLLTPLAKETQWEKIEEEAKSLNIKVNAIDLSDEIDDTRQFLEHVATKLPIGCSLTLDLTQGLRHHAFLVYALALYLKSFREIEIQGAWYCNLFVKDTAKAFVDLKPIVDLADWFHAISNFQNHGITDELVILLQKQATEIAKRAEEESNNELNKLATPLKQYSSLLNDSGFAYQSGLTLELGKAHRNILGKKSALLNSVFHDKLPLSTELIEMMTSHVEKSAFQTQTLRKGKWKEAIVLDLEELRRQAGLIDSYLDRQQYSLAIGLMREWVISWLMLSAGQTEGWLDYSSRNPFGRKLGGLLFLSKDKAFSSLLSSNENEFAKFWNTVSQELRNSFAHHGMCVNTVKEPAEKVANLRAFWTKLKAGEIDPPEKSTGGGGHLLICPMGHSPGVLYSAILNLEHPPNRLLVICSQESSEKIDEAIVKSGVADLEVKKIIMKDPGAGTKEFAGLKKEAQDWLFTADVISANLTGGTSLMAVLVGQLVTRATYSFQQELKEFILIDRRPYEEQKGNPWVKSEIHFLNKNEEDKNE